MSQSKQSRERGGKRTARGSPSGFDLSALRPFRGRTLLDITHEEDRGATETCIAEAYNGRRRAYRLDKRFLRKDGGIMWADVSLVFVPANGSNAAFFSAVIIDRTERK